MIELRAARSTDAGTIGSILSEFVAKTTWMPQLHTQAQDIAHAGAMIERGWVTVAVQDNKVIGFAARNQTELNALYVAHQMRGQQVGTRLLEHLKEQTDVLSLWTFQANQPAKTFYLKHGFRDVERTDGAGTEEKLPDIHFKWQREAL